MLPFPPVPTNGLFRNLRISQIIEETAAAKTFVLEPVTGNLPYLAGQFLTFVFPSLSGLSRRSYSLSSAPGESPSITVKRISNGLFSRPLLEQAEPGDLLTIAGGASGFFTLPPDRTSYDQVFFLAAGSGITPVYSLIKSLVKDSFRLPAVLVYSNSSPEKAMFRKPLEGLASANSDRLKIEWLYSNHQDLWKARLNKLVLERLLRVNLKGSPGRTLVYLCGPFEYMRMAAIVLLSEGIPQENIKREVFTPDIPRSPERPPDVAPHRVKILIGGMVHELTVKYPDSILAAARKKGIELPYSCEAGRCGSCVASCTMGKVWMRYNEVLTDREVENGRVLICNGFPVGGDVVIDFVRTL